MKMGLAKWSTLFFVINLYPGAVCTQNRFKNDAFKRVSAVSDRCKTGGRMYKERE